MKRIANFFKSILPVLVMLLLQFVILLVMTVILILASGGSFSDVMSGISGTLAGTAVSTNAPAALTDVVYGAAALLFFAIWFRRGILLPLRDQKKAGAPRGFSFHTIMAILFLGIGLYYVTSLVVDLTALIRPEWLNAYNSMVDNVGYADPTFLLIVYSVILAPAVEELTFRGLTLTYACKAFPFWLANIWQALLFGVMHFNLMQGIYAFVMGLFLGFVAHRGRGIRYSIPVHILFNIIGLWFSGLIGLTFTLNYAIAAVCGSALTVFAVWLFYTDFTPAGSPRSRKKR